MSMNRYMHPRNIYKNPPNFKQLAIDYPEFRQHVKQELTGKVTLDFKDVNALRALSRTLLKKDFDLNVDIPCNKLIPTIPLRLNYLLWLEDLLNIEKNTEQIHGIDIGTGASCVYPLIAAKKFNWKIIGTEIDKESIIYAKQNVQQNLLEHFVLIHEATSNSILLELVTSSNRNFDFCMCNPPFFSSTQELDPFFKSRKSTRPHPKNAFCASTNEVVANGGEIEFVTKLIRESEQLRNQIKIYSTMLGHKSSLVPLKALLREIEVCSFKQTEFCQGHTTRWGLAWTFCDIDLRKIPSTLSNIKSKSKPPLSYVIPRSIDKSYTLENINESLKEKFVDLEFVTNEFKKTKAIIMYDVIAYSNTWSNQRRKRRLKLKCSEYESNVACDDSIDSKLNSSNETVKSHNSEETNFEAQGAFDKFAGLEIASTTPKRELEDEDEYYNNKKFKGFENKNNNNFLAKFFITLKKQNDSIVLDLFTSDNSTKRETIHRILQYLKNNLK
ncbi:U6 small nuclear RNA (adenine-(43)-N(6))-methyltransferase [Harmonia axyridis]|uniref:U6 small nuclear RNA (adenine-(43)-N(6))-methyltransferase n=1 Tax=Harmonia axyridis TaxID=115357 RepID=UPI001E275101|nr:U6 small nuclear RNA (adenine-(43)-N(6))-methyltransferase [Harmonia axyridis]